MASRQAIISYALILIASSHANNLDNRYNDRKHVLKRFDIVVSTAIVTKKWRRREHKGVQIQVISLIV